MLREKQIREKIWQIIKEETTKAIRPKTNTDLEAQADAEKIRQRVQKRIDTLLNDNDAILVYQP